MSLSGGENVSTDDCIYSPSSTLDGHSDDDLISCSSDRRTGKICRRGYIMRDKHNDRSISFCQKSHKYRYHPYSPSCTPETNDHNSRESESLWSSRDYADEDTATTPICQTSKNSVLYIDPISVKYLLGQIVIQEEPGKLRVSVSRQTRRQKFVSRIVIFTAMFMFFLSVTMVIVSLMMSSSIDHMGKLY